MSDTMNQDTCDGATNAPPARPFAACTDAELQQMTEDLMRGALGISEGACRSGPDSLVAPEGPDAREPQMCDHAADDKVARDLAIDALQSIADSEPDEDTDGAQEVLASTPYAHMYVLNGSVIEDAFYRRLSDAFFDGAIRRGDYASAPAAEPVEAGERERRLESALQRIIGMCDVPPICTCGRPNGIPAVVSCARTALAQPPASSAVPTPYVRQAWEDERAAYYAALLPEGVELVNRVTSRIVASGAASPVTGERERAEADWRTSWKGEGQPVMREAEKFPRVHVDRRNQCMGTVGYLRHRAALERRHGHDGHADWLDSAANDLEDMAAALPYPRHARRPDG